jgi:hypothetical protein
MSMFEIYTKTVTITTPKGPLSLSIRPLSGRFLPKLYSVIGKMSNVADVEDSGNNAKEFFNNIDEETVEKAHSICLETMIKSYPAEDKQALDEFVSQNLLTLLPAIIEVNLNQKV